MAFAVLSISAAFFIFTKIFLRMSSPKADGDVPGDSELWLFFDPPIEGNDKAADLKLLEVVSDSSLNIRPMCILKSALGSSEHWSPYTDLNDTPTGVVAVGIRIEGGAVLAATETITWTTVFKSGDSDEDRISFVTQPAVDEGFVPSSVTTGRLDRRFRFLLVHNTCADPLPTAPLKTWLHSLPAGQVLMTGHRGVGSEPASEPENSIAAFAAAHRVGADLVELDVQLTKDGLPCIYHDLSVPLPGQQNGTLVLDLEWPELRQRIPHVTNLHEVLEKVNSELGIDVEVKYPNNMVNGDLESEENYLSLMADDGHKTGITRRWSKNRVADSVLRPLIAASNSRSLFLSTFQPDLALTLARKLTPHVRRRLPVVFLTRGETHESIGTPRQHSDPRSSTVDSGVAWAKAANLDGVAPYAASLLGLKNVREKFDRNHMPAVVWGKELNSLERLKQLINEGWVSMLIFDQIDRLLPEIRQQ